MQGNTSPVTAAEAQAPASLLLEMISASAACIPGCEELVTHPELALEPEAGL